MLVFLLRQINMLTPLYLLQQMQLLLVVIMYILSYLLLPTVSSVMRKLTVKMISEIHSTQLYKTSVMVLTTTFGMHLLTMLIELRIQFKSHRLNLQLRKLSSLMRKLMICFSTSSLTLSGQLKVIMD